MRVEAPHTPSFMDYVSYGWNFVQTIICNIMCFIILCVLFTIVLPITLPLFYIGKAVYDENLYNH